jgi:multidrug resistance efflux pump
MLTKLRSRPRPDDLKTQQRRTTNRFGRLVYLSLLGVFSVALLNFLFGDFVFLRADGQVVRDRTTIAATFIARVETIEVQQGEIMDEGQPILQLQSSEMLDRLANLSARRAELVAKAAAFRIRSVTVHDLLPLAERRATETDRVLTQFDQLTQAQLVTSARYDGALLSRLEAQQTVVQLRAESATLDSELAPLETAIADATAALSDLRTHYSEGIVRAPVDGTVGTQIPSPGDVYRPGETIVSIYSGEAYVLAYLPRRYLFPIHAGMEVNVTSGRQVATGVISEILPVTSALPEEFQNTFEPRDRSQLARIRLIDANDFPLHEKVHLTGIYSFL